MIFNRNWQFVIAATSIIFLSGCASRGAAPTLKPRAEAGQMEAFRSGTTFVSSSKPSSFLTLSVVQEKILNDKPPTIMVTVRNTGSDPIDLKLADFALTLGEAQVKLMSRQEVVDAIGKDQMWRTVALALAGGIDAGRANAAAKNTSFSGSGTTEYRNLEGRNIGTSQSTFQGSITNSAAAQSAMSDASDRTDASIARVRAAGESSQATANRLILDRETIFPNSAITFMLVPQIESPSKKEPALFAFHALIGSDRHKLTIVKSAGE